MKKNPTITKVRAMEILDSRGNPTIRVEIETMGGVRAAANVPSGASTGTHEALELRDNDKKRYHGKGVLKACQIVEKKIFPLIKGIEVTQQQKIDRLMIDEDGTGNKGRLGANAILGVSLAAARAGAMTYDIPLFRYLQKIYGFKKTKKLPNPMLNLINGGLHADSGLDIQEFMVIPDGIKGFSLKMRAASEVFIELGKLLKEKKYSTAVGNEGGFAPKLKSNRNAPELISQAVKKAGYKLGKEIKLGIDAAASEFYNGKEYNLKLDKKKLSSGEMVRFYKKWIKDFPFIIIEDPLSEDDWEGWSKMQKETGDNLTIIGDDLTVTSTARLQEAIDKKACNGVLIKTNQIGSLSETIECIRLGQVHKFKIAISHRSGETSDSFIADLAVAVGADFIKTGAPSRSERLAKYNRLLEIEKWEK